MYRLRAPELLAPGHDLEGFRCGVASLDNWLVVRARNNQASGASRTYVSVDESGKVIAYYALASSAVVPAAAPGRFRRNMPDPIPVVVLARLAVAGNFQGRGLGRALFVDAAQRVLGAAALIGIRGMVVHALSDDAKAFYQGLGLDASPLDPMTLMVTLADLELAVGSGP